MTDNSSLLVNSHHGIYISQIFVEGFSHYIKNKEEIADDLKTILTKGENNDEEWCMAWDNILSKAKLTDDNGRDCVLFQGGGAPDLWAVPVDELDQIEED